MNQTNPSALITGASSGIGLALAENLINQGYKVQGIARDFSKTECKQLDAVSIDLANLGQLPNQLSQFKLAPDLLVLNAGFGQFGGLEQFSHQQIENLINTNLTSHIFLLKHFLPKFKQQGGGDIVLLGSESSLQGGKSGAVYCATKFAIRGLAQSLRADCSNANIRVILVNPGPVTSNFFNDLSFEPHDGEEFSIQPESVAKAIVDAINQPRNVVVDEINLQPMKRSFQKK